MTKQNQTFRLEIIDHFDDIINQIDIKTETLLQDQMLTEEKKNQLNEIREEQIEKIKKIKEINLKHLQNEEEQLGDLEKLIQFDCVLLEQTKSLNGLDLWITSWFYNKENLEFLKVNIFQHI